MSDQKLTDASSVTGGGEISESVIELNIKTLDSQVFIFQVPKNMLVSEFKEKIAGEVGLPVGQQRLIFRGKVLKDDHALSEYHVESGHTLHLVARQPTEAQAPSGTNSGEASSNSGQDANAAGLPRTGQISHSVVLGTLDVGEQGEGAVPDISRVIGAVLNSMGLGGQNAANVMGETHVMGGPQPTMQFGSPIPASQGNESEGTPGNNATQSQAETRGQPGQAFSSQSFVPQSFQIPMGAAVQIPMGVSVPISSLNAPIPDSLRTISEFMSRMEPVLSQNGSEPNESQTNSGDQPSSDLPPNARGLPTPEALVAVLRHAQRLLGDRTTTALSRIIRRLEQDGSSTDTTVRGEIQRETMQLGMAMQHLGALFLELGRTVLTLRMGQSSADAYVNAGPAVYISSSGPNPIMVQPFPLQTSSLFGGSVAPLNSGNLGPVGIGATPRHVNIHIHTAVGRGGPNGAQGRQSHRTGSGSTVHSRARDPRNANGGDVPSRSSVTVPSASQTRGPVSQPQPQPQPQPHPGLDMLPNVVAEISSPARDLAIQTGNQAPLDGQPASSTIQDPSSISAVNAEANIQPGNLAGTGVRELNMSSSENKPNSEEFQGSSQYNNNETPLVDAKDVPPTSSGADRTDLPSGDATLKSVSDSDRVPVPGQRSDNVERATAVPLGLGLGGLQPKKKSRQPKLEVKASDSTSSSVSDQNQEAVANGQHVMQSLASMMNRGNMSNAPLPGQLPAGFGNMVGGGGQSRDRGTGQINAPLPGQLPAGLGNMIGGGQSRGQGTGQTDVANAMTEVLHSPALSGLLGGISQQTGVGSPNDLRSMLEQFTRNPAMMNTVNQLAQQFDGQDIGNMLSGMGRGQGGGLDLAGMVQQMMPIVSQALGGGPATLQQPLSSVLSDQSYGRSIGGDDKASDEDLQIDLEPVLQRIENQNSSQEIFRSLVETAAAGRVNDGVRDDLVNGLSSEEEGLASEFMEVLRQDLRARLQGEKGPSDSS